MLSVLKYTLYLSHIREFLKAGNDVEKAYIFSFTSKSTSRLSGAEKVKSRIVIEVSSELGAIDWADFGANSSHLIVVGHSEFEP